jgi:hypothetical protein
MRRCLEYCAVAVTLIAVAGCDSSPTAPEQVRPAEFNTAALFSRLAGAYTLTFEADESCPLPPSLQDLTYDVVLMPTQFRYIGVHVPGKPFVGDLWVLEREDQGFTLRWNVDCEVPDTAGSTTFYLCGQGAAFAVDGIISGVLGGRDGYLDADHRPFCANGAHRFEFQRRD